MSKSFSILNKLPSNFVRTLFNYFFLLMFIRSAFKFNDVSVVESTLENMNKYTRKD